jgi:hypothetical protein
LQISRNGEAAKRIGRGVLDQFGWETADMGKVEADRAILPLCMVWLILGLLRNEWSPAMMARLEASLKSALQLTRFCLRQGYGCSSSWISGWTVYRWVIDAVYFRP